MPVVGICSIAKATNGTTRRFSYSVSIRKQVERVMSSLLSLSTNHFDLAYAIFPDQPILDFVKLTLRMSLYSDGWRHQHAHSVILKLYVFFSNNSILFILRIELDALIILNHRFETWKIRDLYVRNKLFSQHSYSQTKRLCVNLSRSI